MVSFMRSNLYDSRKSLNVEVISTDQSNPEQDNPRYYRTWMQKTFPGLYALLGKDLKDPQHHSNSTRLHLGYLDLLLSFRYSYPKTALFIHYFILLLLIISIPFVWMVSIFQS